MSLEYKLYKARTDEGVARYLNALTKSGSKFSVISISEVRGLWSVFYSIETPQEPPADRSWIETAPVNHPRSWTTDPIAIARYESRGFFKRIFGQT